MTPFVGPLVGTQVGEPIGGAANDDTGDSASATGIAFAIRGSGLGISGAFSSACGGCEEGGS